MALLFKSASYQKRSHIRSFIPLAERLGDPLLFAKEIPRALGLMLAQRLAEAPSLANAIRAELKDWEGRNDKDELDVLRRYARQGADISARNDQPADHLPETLRQGKAKTTFQISRPQDSAKCTASNDRLEIRLARDFSAIDRRKLEKAVAVLLKQID